MWSVVAQSQVLDELLGPTTLMAALVLGMIVLLAILRRVFFRSGEAGLSRNDVDFLTRLGDNGGLTPEEMKKVREAVLRRSLDTPGTHKPPRTDDLPALMARIAAETKNKQAEENAPDNDPATETQSDSGESKMTIHIDPKTGKKHVTSLNDIIHRDQEPDSDAQAPPSKTKPAPQPQSAVEGTGQAVDIDTLLAKGLITEDEYNRLKQHFQG